jgi:hypothetical protein
MPAKAMTDNTRSNLQHRHTSHFSPNAAATSTPSLLIAMSKAPITSRRRRLLNSTNLLVVFVTSLLQIGYCRADDATPPLACGAVDTNLTVFDGPAPPQTATTLNLQFTCIYNDFSADATEYQIVPAPVIKIQPGDDVAFYSNPPNIYDWVDQDGTGTTLSLAHNAFTSASFDGDEGQRPISVEFIITWPASQLERISVFADNAVSILVVIDEGFTALQSIEVLPGGGPTGLEAYLSTDGPVSLKLAGGMALGVHVAAVGSNTQLKLDVQTDTADIEISSTNNNIIGEVHAANVADRTGNVLVDGVGVDGIVSTGEGPGMLFANDCALVDGECQPLDDTMTLQAPNTDCQAVDVCLTSVSTLSQPERACTLVDGGTSPECANEAGAGSPTDAPASGAVSLFVKRRRCPSNNILTTMMTALVFSMSIQALY